MAVNKEVYSNVRYLVAGSVMTVRDQKWFSIDDIDARAYLEPSLEHEVESLEAMNIAESRYSPVEGKKYRITDEYFGDFKKARGYFNTAYEGNLRHANEEFGEQDLEELRGELKILDLLS